MLLLVPNQLNAYMVWQYFIPYDRKGLGLKLQESIKRMSIKIYIPPMELLWEVCEASISKLLRQPLACDVWLRLGIHRAVPRASSYNGNRINSSAASKK